MNRFAGTATLGGALVALLAPGPGAARVAASPGNLCALVSARAADAAALTKPCAPRTVRAFTRPSLSVADWGTRETSPAHFMSVSVGPTSAFFSGLKPNRLLPLPGKLRGPVSVAVGVHAYYTVAAYQGSPAGFVRMRFPDQGELCEIALADATGAALPGAMAVARSIAARL